MKKSIRIELNFADEDFAEYLAHEIESEFGVETLSGFGQYIYVTLDAEFTYMSKLLCWLEFNYTVKKSRIKEITVTAKY